MSNPRTRHELKYVVDLALGEAFVAETEEFCTRDPHAGPDGYYETASIYYDTLDYRFYWDRQESVGFRRKIRLRRYVSREGEAQLFLEIKEKHKHLVAKKRCLIQLGAEALPLNEPIDVALSDIIARAEPSVAADEASYLHDRLQLQPIVNVRYVRKPLAARCDATLRITIDKRLTAGPPVLGDYNPAIEKFFLPPHLAILEIKSAHSLPLWLVSMIQRYEFRRTRFSKYCAALDALQPAVERARRVLDQTKDGE